VDALDNIDRGGNKKSPAVRRGTLSQGVGKKRQVERGGKRGVLGFKTFLKRKRVGNGGRREVSLHLIRTPI